MTDQEKALAKIGTPADRAACFVRSWGLDGPAFKGLEESLKAQFKAAEASAFEESATLCDNEADAWEQCGLRQRVEQADTCARRIRTHAVRRLA